MAHLRVSTGISAFFELGFIYLVTFAKLLSFTGKPITILMIVLGCATCQNASSAFDGEEQGANADNSDEVVQGDDDDNDDDNNDNDDDNNDNDDDNNDNDDDNNDNTDDIEDSEDEIPVEEEITCIAPERDQSLDIGDAGMNGDGGDIEDGADGGIEPVPHSILVIIDKSGSMDGYWADGSKWNVATDTLIKVVGMAQSYTTVGAIVFPSHDQCQVAPITDDRQINFKNGAQFLSAFETQMTEYPSGGTPMEMAFRRADQAIVEACRDGMMEKPLSVMVFTDGEPNCDGDNSQLTRFPKKWLEHGVKTYVIGLPGSEEAGAILNDIAGAGGTEQFIQPSDPDELEDDTILIIC